MINGNDNFLVIINYKYYLLMDQSACNRRTTRLLY